MPIARTPVARIRAFFLRVPRDEKVLFLSSFFVKLIFIGLIISSYGFTQVPWQPDSDGYLPLADSIYFNHAFTYSTSKPFIPEGMHAPGYPFFLALTAAPFRSVVPALIIQSLLFSLAVVLFFRTASAYLPRRSAFFGALLFGVEPFTSFIVAYPLSESMFLFLFLGALYSYHRALSSLHPIRSAVIGGFLFGFAILTRPIALYLIPVLIFFGGVLFLYKKIGWKTVVVGFLCVLLPVSLWAWRNEQQFGVWTIASKGPHTVYFYYVEQMLEYREGWAASRAIEYLLNRVRETYPAVHSVDDMRSPVYSAYLNAQSFELLLESPWVYLKVHGASMGTFFLSDGYRMLAQSLGFPIAPMPNITKAVSSGEWGTIEMYFMYHIASFVLFVLGFVFWSSLSLLAFGALFLVWKKGEPTKHRIFVIFAGVFMVSFAVLTGPVAQARYRIVATPFMCILAAYSAYWIREKILAKKNSVLPIQ